jgi:repressor LexA
MSEKRASKKQRELLSFIEGFIKQYDYGPSYREIMRALDYKSVSTVAVHVNGLIASGLLQKKDNSARSLEIVSNVSKPVVEAPESIHKIWLQKEIDKRTKQLKAKEDETLRNEIVILQESYRILRFEVDKEGRKA